MAAFRQTLVTELPSCQRLRRVKALPIRGPGTPRIFAKLQYGKYLADTRSVRRCLLNRRSSQIAPPVLLQRVPSQGASKQDIVRVAQQGSMASKGVSLAGRLAERYFYDFSLYKMYFKDKMDYPKYVALRHNFTLVGGIYFLMTVPFPFVPPFPMMGLCPRGYEGTFMCEPDKDKALEMYKEWKYGKKA